ncbi:uncharacterized protein LOC142767457 [Rhipicephalus microplus]|uniref:uncharacterized protein LOC142767457 n=1 Tax=Rhipicephalus microplus TaxID=6941 RepID=UPI003F6D210C
MADQKTDDHDSLDSDCRDIRSRFPGLEVFIPCAALCGMDHETPNECCQLMEQLAIWNQVLGYSGFQLREITVPGEVSLVRVAHEGDQQELRSRDARLLFYSLLSQHRCVVGLDLDDALVEGSGLGECRDRVIWTLQQNNSLRSLSLASTFNDYRFIQEDLFAAIGAATQLQRLDITAVGEVGPGLTDLLCSLLYEARLSTLSIQGLHFNEQTTELLLDALRANNALVELSLHSSVLWCKNLADVPKLCSYLASKASLRHLTLGVTHWEPVEMYKEIEHVLVVLAKSGNLQTLKLSGFLLDGNCACALSRLVAQHGGPLRELDIGDCRWTSDGSAKSDDYVTDWDQPGTSSTVPVHAWLAPFDDMTQVTLVSLSINLEGWKPDDYTVLFFAAAVIESLKTIVVSGVYLSALPRVCRTIRDAGVGEKVHMKNEYVISPVTLTLPEDCREQINHIVVSSYIDRSMDLFCKSVQFMSCFHNLNTLGIFLSQEVLDDVPTMRSLCSYIKAATRLRELELGGCHDPHLHDSLRVENEPHSLLLDVAFSNQGLRAVSINRVHFGEVNLCFLAQAVFSNETIDQLDVSSSDSSENEELLRLFAAGFETNQTLLRIRLPNCGGDYSEVLRRANVEAIMSRNVGYVTCAAHYVAWNTDQRRCMKALLCVSKSPALIDKVKELLQFDEDDAKKLVVSRLSEASTVR